MAEPILNRPCVMPRKELHACFVVRDHNGQALAYIYYENGFERLVSHQYGFLFAAFLYGIFDIASHVVGSAFSLV